MVPLYVCAPDLILLASVIRLGPWDVYKYLEVHVELANILVAHQR